MTQSPPTGDLVASITGIAAQLERMASGSAYVQDGFVRVLDPPYLIDKLRATATALTTLERELEEAREKIVRQATEIQRMARKIRNQRGMARTTWAIVESRTHWTRGILNRNQYLDFCTAERAKSLASQAEVESLKALVEAAFRDGLTYGTNVIVTDADEAWRTSRVRAALHQSQAQP